MRDVEETGPRCGTIRSGPAPPCGSFIVIKISFILFFSDQNNCHQTTNEHLELKYPY